MTNDVRQVVKSLRMAVDAAFAGSAETGSFFRSGVSGEWTPSVFMTLNQLDDALIALRERAEKAEAEVERLKVELVRTRDEAMIKAPLSSEQAKAALRLLAACKEERSQLRRKLTSPPAPSGWQPIAAENLRQRAVNLRGRALPGDIAKADFLDLVADDLWRHVAPVAESAPSGWQQRIAAMASEISDGVAKLFDGDLSGGLSVEAVAQRVLGQNALPPSSSPSRVEKCACGHMFHGDSKCSSCDCGWTKPVDALPPVSEALPTVGRD